MTLRMRTLPRFPAMISGSTGIKVTREGVDLIIMPDAGALVRIPSVRDPATSLFVAWDSQLDSYSTISFDDMFAAVVDITGLMSKNTYDPTNKNQDIFAYAVTQAATRLPLAGGIMTGAIQDLVIAPSSAPTKKAAFDLSLVTAGQQRSVKVPDTDTALSKWEVIGDYVFGAVASMDFTNLGAFKRLRLTGHLYPSVVTEIFIRTSTNNGSTFDSGSTDYTENGSLAQNTTNSAFSTTSGALNISNAGGVNGSANNGLQFNLQVDNFNQTSYCHFEALVRGNNAGGDFWGGFGGRRSQATARNAFRILPGSGTLSGFMLLEGVRG